MPEIPDLNIFRKNLAIRLAGQTLSSIRVLVPRRLKVPESALQDAFNGQQLTGILREGKELHFKFANGHVLGLHLMLYGSMHWYQEVNDQKFTIAELLFENGTGLAITDWQKSVILTLDPKPAKVPDALSLPNEYLFNALKSKTHHIKTVLTDGKVVRGIGNAYVDEILYAAKISPYSKANAIPEEAIRQLTQAIHTVLTDAEHHILKNFPDTITEKERDFLQVHRPRQKLTLNGEPILKTQIDSRKTYYVEEQRLFE